MADVTKYQLVPNNILPDVRVPFSLSRTLRRSTAAFAYGVVLVFVIFTIFIAFSPSSSSSNPWFINIFTLNPSSSSPTFKEESYRSHFPPIFSYIFPNSSDSSGTNTNTPKSQNIASNNLTNTQLPPDRNHSVDNPQISFSNTSRSHDSTDSKVPTSIDPPPSTKNGTETQVQNCVGESCVGKKQSNNTSISGQSQNSTRISAVPISNNSTKPQVQVNQTVNSASNSSRSQNTATSQVPTSNNTLSSEKDENLNKNCSNGGCNNTSISGQSQNSTLSALPTSNNSTKPQVQVNQTVNSASNSSRSQNTATSQVPTSNNTLSSEKDGNLNKNCSNGGCDGKDEKVGKSDFEASLSKKQGKELIAELVGCDLYDGNWVRDESYPLYKTESCPLLDEQFKCVLNGRPDTDYQKLKWKPKGCSLPRLNAKDMLERLRGKRLVFVGDSLNRNMWESLVCILRKSVKNKKRVYEAFGRHYFKTGASYSFVFKDYNCTVEFFVAPFLVQQWEVQNKNGGEAKETLRLDLMVKDSVQFKEADFLVFNTGHWWTHDKTSKGEDYYQEGSHVYKQLDVTEAFRRAITTWARWVDANVNPQKTHVFFRGYSVSHFSGGQWNSGGSCDSETEPIKNEAYLSPYPWKMKVFETVMKGMKTPVSYLNVTKMTDYRKEGHPSRYRKHHSFDLKAQDCSHWCLPGVPDSWNELLYAELLRKQYKDQQQKN